MMLAVMKLQRFSGNVRSQGVFGVGQCGKGVFHENLLKGHKKQEQAL
jgi:hypothetical protein